MKIDLFNFEEYDSITHKCNILLLYPLQTVFVGRVMKLDDGILNEFITTHSKFSCWQPKVSYDYHVCFKQVLLNILSRNQCFNHRIVKHRKYYVSSVGNFWIYSTSRQAPDHTFWFWHRIQANGLGYTVFMLFLCPLVHPSVRGILFFQYLEKSMVEFHKIWQTH